MIYLDLLFCPFLLVPLFYRRQEDGGGGLLVQGRKLKRDMPKVRGSSDAGLGKDGC